MYYLVVIDDYNRFTWVFFLATMDETSGILKSFITRIEILVDHKVKVIRCDNGTGFKNREMNQFCEIKDHLGKFNGKADEGFFVEYSLDSKAFRVFNSRTRIVEENLHIRFSESTPNVVRSGPDLLFDIDAPTRTKNYEPIVAGTQCNGFVGTKASDNSFYDDGSKPSCDDGKKVDKDSRKDSECKEQENEDNVNSINNVNTTGNVNNVSSTVNAASTNEVNVVGGKTSIELTFDSNMPALEDYSIFDFSRNDEDDGAVADMNNLDTTIQVNHNPTIRLHKDHPLDQVIRYLQSATQTRKMSKNLGEHGFVFKNKKDEKGIVIRNKSRLVAQWYIQEEGIDYDEGFAPVSRIEAIRLFLAYTSFKDFVVYQMDVKSDFVYGKIEEEVYVCQPPGFEDPDILDRVYKVEKALYGLHQAHKAWSMIGSLMYLTSLRPDIIFAVYACARYQFNPKVSHLHAVKMIFSDYARASLDRKSTTGGYQFLGCRLISWQCKKQTVVANSITEAEYVAASSCCGEVLWIQN
ncbi:ribonuclease H-like domain-containing protein [Tanacetum coccineum]